MKQIVDVRYWDHGRGHVSLRILGRRITIYGDNAMHCAVGIRLRHVYLCVHPTFRRWPWYVYISRNATPWGAIWGIGPGFERRDRRKADRRRHLLRVLRQARQGVV
jgi:hypothetical protein